jgi:hypothetical protein|tara:strand:+ start:4158 stop:4694 length:537 start_codon:yes stop_codon:yes gene_type:complete
VRISPTYRDLNRDLHRNNPDYGKAAHALAPWVVSFAKETGVQSLLDYGCGKGTLRPAILALEPGLLVSEYDPAIPGKDLDPEPCELVICIDVLEHIEPDCLPDVLAHVRNVGQGGAMFIIDTVLAEKTLADGRNAHLIVEDQAWWENTLNTYFDVKFASPLAPPPERRLIMLCAHKST